MTPETLGTTPEARAVISPDGKRIAFLTEQDGQRTLWVRGLVRERPRKLDGTEGAEDPFWSPDSQWVSFGAGTELKRIAFSGGEPVTLCELPQAVGVFSLVGGSWSPDGGRIVFSSGLQLYEIASRGGTPKLLLEPDEGERFVVSPHFLPEVDGPPALVYASGTAGDSRLGVLDLSTGQRRELVPGSRPIYSASGHLVYRESFVGDAGLRALPFSLETLATTGEAFPVTESGGVPSVSRDGTLVYPDAWSGGSRRIAVRDRSGKILRTVGGPIDSARTPAVSPNSRFVAVSVEGDIWIYDLERDIETRLTSAEGDERTPVWLSSGRELSYRSRGSGLPRLMTQIADGSAEAKVLWEPQRSRALGTFNWSSDERYLAYNVGAGSGDEEGGIWYHEVGPDGSLSEAKEFLLTPVGEGNATFSPNGRFLAYASNESGRFEVYVRPFPPGPGKSQVSTDGGAHPIWSADGKEIFYVEDSTLMAVPVSAEGNFTPGPPQRLFESDLFRAGRQQRPYYVFPDGQRFVTFAPHEDGSTESASIRVVENWYEEFRDREQE